ncbi:MAG: sulfotransferase, partial [bacterium]
VTSMAHHYQLTQKEALNRMNDKNSFIAKTETHADIFVSSWNLNYQSWKKLKDKVLFIKYEDLIFQKKATLKKIFEYF